MADRTVTLCPVTAADAALVADIRLNPGQDAFVSAPADRLARLGPQDRGFAILQGGTAVGFFLIDLAYPETHPFARPGEAGLRGMVIDAAAQGLGIARAALAQLPALMAETFPDLPALVLTVNDANPRALRVYLGAGFADTGAIYLGGRSGPQRILRLQLGR